MGDDVRGHGWVVAFMESPQPDESWLWIGSQPERIASEINRVRQEQESITVGAKRLL